MTNRLNDRNYLRNRHRLSHQQIDTWLGEKREKEFLHEKLNQLKAVKNFLWVSSLLNKNNITHTCFKGPLLSYRIYNDPTVRISHDIDLLIDKEMIVPVMDILISNGFQITENMFWPQKKAQQELFIKAIHHLSFYNSDLQTCVEVHWVLIPTLPVRKKKMQKLIAENQTTIEFSGQTFTVLSPEFEFLYLLVHGARHGWNRLKWLVDINDYPKEKLDINKLQSLINQFKAWRIIGQVNILLDYFFKQQLSIKKSIYLPSYFIRYPLTFIKNDNAQIQFTTKGIIKYNWYLLFIFVSICYKYNFIIENIFVRLADIKRIDSSYKIVYYIYRPYSFIKRRFLHV